ncbi:MULTISPECIES: hypothetical protein [Mycobacterium]|jgi:hypothetical protein|uniref:hypothetical protein n=1 Tax=Mycobacterium TaxID=1763 RepID=UPI0009B8CF72|nr:MULTISPECIES: hypothetical protein [Mycobacterium]ASW84252.1 hypothetical protein CKJ61_04605 [Mycobacterium intracellulare]UQB93347.1 hypothetical protein KN252_05060 [Mycobacterium intracellulare]UQC03222.1 hypothetical protein KN247_04575 [Mycobacterium intracellulare]WSE45946.1 hypothetical protein QGN30_23135 [Mycobacterium sp. 3-98]
MTTAPNSALIPTFAALRFATGVAAWAVPARAARLFGLASARQQPFITQLFGSRELTLALAVTDPSQQLRTRALQLGLLTDALDIVAALRGVQRQTLPPAGAIVTGGGAALFLGLGLAALANQQRANASTG